MLQWGSLRLDHTVDVCALLTMAVGLSIVCEFGVIHTSIRCSGQTSAGPKFLHSLIIEEIDTICYSPLRSCRSWVLAPDILLETILARS